MRRVALVAALMFGLMLTVVVVAVVLLSTALDLHERPGILVPLALVVVVGLVVGLGWAARSLRRMALPIGDVMEAVERVAEGELTARVRPRGPGDVRRLGDSFNAMAERLEADEERRRNLLADIAHELRTPLAVIHGNAEAILDGVYPPDRSHLEPIKESTEVMARLLDDLQTLSLAEAGALRLHRSTNPPGDIVRAAVSSFGPRAEAAAVRLEGRVADGLPELDVDAVRIGEVLTNLLSNAVRHAGRGGYVTATAGAQGDGDAIVFSVTDSGPGIDPDDLPHIFERFVKSADSGGAGLGLAIAKSLVEAHGGTISARSEPGAGTTMEFVLPVPASR